MTILAFSTNEISEFSDGIFSVEKLVYFCYILACLRSNQDRPRIIQQSNYGLYVK